MNSNKNIIRLELAGSALERNWKICHEIKNICWMWHALLIIIYLLFSDLDASLSLFFFHTSSRTGPRASIKGVSI